MRPVTARRILVASAACFGLGALVVVPGQASFNPGSGGPPHSDPSAPRTADTVAAREPLEPSPFPEPEPPAFTESTPAVATTLGSPPSPSLSVSTAPASGTASYRPRQAERETVPPGTFTAAGSDCITGDTLTLRWSSSAGASQYRIQGPGVSMSVQGTSVTFRCPAVREPSSAAYTIVALGDNGHSTSTQAKVAVGRATPAPVWTPTPSRKPSTPPTRPSMPATSEGIGLNGFGTPASPTPTAQASSAEPTP